MMASPRSARTAPLAIALALVVTSCGVGGGSAPQATAASQATAPTSATTPATTTTASAPASSAVDLTNLPLGDHHVSTTTAEAGSILVCRAGGDPGGGGAGRDGPWIHADGTFDLTKKLTVQGSVSWPTANVSITESNGHRVITGNNLPVGHATGVFPIATSDPAHDYDANPNHIAAQAITRTLTLTPTVGATPGCVGGGPIGYAITGVPFFDGLDAQDRDAVAHEIQDRCGGHPQQQGSYHYHSASTCIPGDTTHTPTLIGYALDGFGIYNSYDASGRELTNADLDECHGTTSEVPWDGATRSIYHYVATAAYPYLIGCYRGGNVGANERPAGPPPGRPPGLGPIPGNGPGPMGT